MASALLNRWWQPGLVEIQLPINEERLQDLFNGVLSYERKFHSTVSVKRLQDMLDGIATRVGGAATAESILEMVLSKGVFDILKLAHGLTGDAPMTREQLAEHFRATVQEIDKCLDSAYRTLVSQLESLSISHR